MHLLVVCSGNICRSPMAEGILRDLLARASGEHVVESAGTLDIEGRAPAQNALLACHERGIDISALRSSGLTAAHLERADVVLCMERRHVEECLARASGAPPRVFLLGDGDPSLPGGEVPDPVGRDLEAFRACFDLLARVCARFVATHGLLPYSPCFCEENVWHLLDDPRLRGREAYAVIISNEERQVALFAQRAALIAGTPVVWDYHVVVIARAERDYEVWDLDCIERFPASFDRWRALSFGLPDDLPEEMRPLFRVVSAVEYRARLSTDRRHMRTPDGGFLHEPPPWPLIQPPAEEPNLERFIDVTTPFVGELLDLRALVARFGSTGP